VHACASPLSPQHSARLHVSKNTACGGVQHKHDPLVGCSSGYAAERGNADRGIHSRASSATGPTEHIISRSTKLDPSGLAPMSSRSHRAWLSAIPPWGITAQRSTVLGSGPGRSRRCGQGGRLRGAAMAARTCNTRCTATCAAATRKCTRIGPSTVPHGQHGWRPVPCGCKGDSDCKVTPMSASSRATRAHDAQMAQQRGMQRHRARARVGLSGRSSTAGSS
jgi:hypothetical protein